MVTLIVPAYNEAKNLKAALKNVPQKHRVIVVDDGSTDNTKHVARSLGHKPLVLSKNHGKMKACMKGFSASRSATCVFMDGDGQFDAREVSRFVDPLKKADIVVGQRDMSTVPIQRRISNAFARICVNYITGVKMRDVLCGFRGVRRDKFGELTFKKDGYFFESEMLMEAAKKGMTISSVPVSVSYDGGSRMPINKSVRVAGWLIKEVIRKSIGG